MRAIRANPESPGTDLLPTRLRPALLAAAALLAVAVAVLAGCGSSSSASQPSLDGTSWKLTGWSVSSQDPGDFTITAEFRDGRIGGKSAVNSYGGPYTAAEDGAFSVGELISTMMAGPEPDMRAEKDYLTLLAAAKQYAVDGQTLTLSDANGNDSLIFTTAAVASPGE
jgi:heat shock protein HslJ